MIRCRSVQWRRVVLYLFATRATYIGGVISYPGTSNRRVSPAGSQLQQTDGVQTGGTFVSSHYQVGPHIVIEYVTRKRLTHRVADDKLLLKYCPFCHNHHDRADNLWKLYVFLSNGRCFCHRCGANKSWFDLKRQLGDLEGVPVQFGEIQTSNKYLCKRDKPTLDQAEMKRQRERLQEEPELLEYLTGTGEGQRQLELAVLKKYCVGAAQYSFSSSDSKSGRELHTCIVFPWTRYDLDAGEIVVDRIKVRSIRSKACQMLLPRGGIWGMFGWHTVPASVDTIVITEGEFDAMAVYQATGRCAISLPNGARSLPIDLLPALERFKTIILWMDDDLAGQESAEKFARKLGLQRTLLVKSKSDDQSGAKDANEALQRGMDIAALLDDAQPVGHEQIVSFRDLKSDILRELREGTKSEGTPFMSLPSLQRILKGHRRGELTVLTGPTGMGKTTVLSQLSLDLAQQGVNTLWGSFEISNVRLCKTLLSQFAGSKLELMEEAVFHEWADAFENLPMHFMRFFGATDCDQVLDAMEYSVYVHDVQHILLDNLQFMLGTTHGINKFDVQDEAISRFRKFATTRNVHITLVIHPRKEPDGQPLTVNSVFGSAKATQESDNVILIQPHPRFHGVRFLKVGKNRFDGELGDFPYRFSRSARRIVELNDTEKQQLKDSDAQHSPNMPEF